jgi:hypothetical protein
VLHFCAYTGYAPDTRIGKRLGPQPTSSCPLSRHYDTWEAELEGDPDKDFLLSGIKCGFPLIDNEAELPCSSVEVANYKSATSPSVISRVEAQIKAELAEGNYIATSEKPIIISALGAIPKSDGGIRLIHDASRPEGHSLNDLASQEECKLQSFKDALDIINPGCYCAKIDLKNAYRSCGIREADTILTGLKWKFIGTDKYVYFKDCRMPFGARRAVYNFHKISQAIKRMMTLRGYNIVVFYDDFFLAEKDFQTCLKSYNTLIKLLRSLGFSINWKKAVDPTQCIVFLGIQIDTVAGTLTLDDGKVTALKSLLIVTLKKKRLTKNQLQSIAGKLSWASVVVPWGKTHTCSFYRSLSYLNKSSHKIVTSKLHSDITFWIKYLGSGSNTRLIWDNRPVLCMFTDSSGPCGGAFCTNGDWLFRSWNVDNPRIARAHINIKELQMGCEAVSRWAPIYPNSRFLVFMDNVAATCIMNKGSSRNQLAIDCMRSLSITAIKYNISVEAFFIPGSTNDIADSISRFHLNGQIQRFMSLLTVGSWPMPTRYYLRDHMSLSAERFLNLQIRKWQALHRDWTVRSLHGLRGH